jgi:hypothetical protein
VCRPAAGACDVAETCSGTADACPPDARAAAGTTCRAAAGTCDLAETCSGTTADCPPDGFRAAGTECRAAAGACDVAESCGGTSPACPADAGRADADADGACDEVDACPATADPAQQDADGDGAGDACDPCTNLGLVTAGSRALKLGRLTGERGDETLRFAGSISVPTAPAIDPVANGIRFLVSDQDGTVLLDAVIPGGAGWKANRSRTSVRWRSGGGVAGIKSVALRRTKRAPSTLAFVVTGNGIALAIPGGGATLRATLVLDPPFAASGQCSEAAFASCRPSRTGKTVACSGSAG